MEIADQPRAHFNTVHQADTSIKDPRHVSADCHCYTAVLIDPIIAVSESIDVYISKKSPYDNDGYPMNMHAGLGSRFAGINRPERQLSSL